MYGIEFTAMTKRTINTKFVLLVCASRRDVCIVGIQLFFELLLLYAEIYTELCFKVKTGEPYCYFSFFTK